MNIPFWNFELSSRMSSRVRIHKCRYNILLTFLMDGGRAPNGIGHLMISFMAEGYIPISVHIYSDIHNHSFNFSGGVRGLGIA